MLLDAVAVLADDLRRSGVAVSIGEVLDAVAAVERAGVVNRGNMHSVLRCTMVKQQAHFPVFDILFDIRFGAGSSSTATGAFDTDDGPVFGDVSLDADEGSAFAVAVQQAIEQHAGLVPGRFLSVEYHVDRVMRRLEEEGALAIGEPDQDDTLGLALARFRQGEHEQAVRDELERQLRARAPEARALRSAERRSAEQLDFLRLSPAEQLQLERVIEDLGRRLAARLRRRQRRTHRGALAMRQTVRQSLSTGGVPFSPVFRRAHPSRPHLVVLADVSGSVASFARFTLQLVHALSRQMAAVEVFAFIDEIDDITKHMTASPRIAEVVADVDSSARTQGAVGHSDYGQVFRTFLDRHGSRLTSATTLLIVGDGRTNYHPPQAGALRSMKRRARRTLWFNPESRDHWGTGDSAVDVYKQHVDEMFECRNLSQLRATLSKL